MSRCRYRYEDLPEHLRSQVDCALRSQKPEVRIQEPKIEPHDAGVARGQRPNKTEARYRAEIIDRRDDVVAVHYEGLTLRMANGHRYTPDWIVVTSVRRIECHEVKGRYALQSQQRARLAFDQARVEFPWFGWVWAVKTPTGWVVDQ